MQRNSVLFDQYLAQLNSLNRSSEPISPLHAAADPRFSTLMVRASIVQERAKQHQVSPENPVHSPSIVTVNSNAWLPTATPEKKSPINQKKSCLSPVWKNRLQGLLIGLAIATVSVGIILAVFLTRPTTNSITTTPTTAPACGSLRWSESSVMVAGNGTYGNASDQLSNPQGLYVDANFAIYVADYNNHRIQQWLPNATEGMTVAGVTGVWGSNNSLLSYPRAVHGNSQRNLYIGDDYGIIVWPLGASVGSRITGFTSLGSISSVYADNNGYIYVSTWWDCAVRMWTPASATSVIVAGGNGCGYGSSQLYSVSGFTVDPLTNIIYIANGNAHTIVAWPVGAANGTIVAGRNLTFGTTDYLLNYARDVQRDSYGNLYVADSNNNRVLLFCQNPPSTNARIIAGSGFTYPYRIALDSNLNLYLLTNNRVLKFTRIA